MACVEVERLLEPVLDTDRLDVAGATLLTCDPEDVTERLPVDCDALLEVVEDALLEVAEDALLEVVADALLEVAEDALLDAALLTLLEEAADATEFETVLLELFRDDPRDATDLPERPLSHPRP